ncbi:MAG: dockerin type I repeat-containing protein [Acutalibacteraceae bacterium]
MVKLHKKAVSACLAAIMAVSTIGTAMAVNVSDVSSDTAAETVGKYATNPIGNGKRATITIDGSHSDWSEDMLIAQGAAWDVANRYKGAHENCLTDCYSLYAAWDDDNLYLGWQMVNTTDTWAREGDGPLSDAGRIGDVPMVLALSIDPSSTGMTGRLTGGGKIWDSLDITFTTHTDALLLMSGKVGQGTPALFKAADAQGNTSYDAQYCIPFRSNGIQYAMEEGCLPSTLWMINGLSTTPEEEIYGGTANYVDARTFVSEDGKTHNTTYDSFYEIKIPFTALSIDAAYLESNGIGVMQLATRGESAIDCLPHDPSMLDNAMGEYAKDPSTSHEKDDNDNITVPFARVGGSVIDPTDPTEPPTPPTETPTQPTDPQPTVLLGDVSLDGAVDLKDAILIQKNVVFDIDFTGAAFLAADVDGNGTVQLRDAIIVQRYTLGLLKNNSYGVGEAVYATGDLG